jgi:hypothetical protein
MSKSHRDFDDKMMHHIFDSNNSGQQRKGRMKRMEELSHSLDDGLNEAPNDDYGRQGGNRGGAQHMERRYDDMDDEEDDYVQDEYIDDYYYSNAKQFDGRPKSYNEKYANSYMYDDYESAGNFHRNRYSLNETAMSKSRYQQQQQSPLTQQKHSTLRRPQGGSSGSNGNPHHGSNKHILFNDEEDVHYVSEKKQSKATAPTSSVKTKAPKKESTSTSLFSSKKKLSKEDLAKPEKSSQQVMKAKLKIQNMSNDDSTLHMRTSPKANTLLRHHSVEAKAPAHGSDRSNMSPTIMEEIEFEMMQDVETETEKDGEREIEEKVTKEKPAKEKSSKKDKDDSAPSTPTTKKSFKAHLTNHKKLFKVPDIDLNHFSKFSCFFSSNKNIAALKGSKKDENTSKSAEALNDPSHSTKTPPESPKKLLKGDAKAEKTEKVEKVEEKPTKASSIRNTTASRAPAGAQPLQSSSEGLKDDNSGSASDNDFEVKFSAFAVESINFLLFCALNKP